MKSSASLLSSQVRELNRQRVERAAREALRPPPVLTVSQWAESNFRLSSEYSAQVGDLRLYSFQREPFDCFSPSHPCREIVIMGASQMLKTLFLLVACGFVIDQDPGPILVVEPREKDSEALSKDRFAPMLRDVPCLKGSVAEAKSRDSANTIDRKTFRGGSITFVSAQKAENAAMRSIRYLLMDEVDRYPISTKREGNFIALAKKRLVTYFWNSKTLIVSTPTVDGDSQIQRDFKRSDQRHRQVKCPHCGGFQKLVFDNLKVVNGDPMSAYYECALCAGAIQEHHKWNWEQPGNQKWVPENPDSDVPGFHISQLHSLVRPWSDIVREWRECEGNQTEQRVFKNTVLAECYVERRDAPDWEILKARSGGYEAGEIPIHVRLLLASVDVQPDRLELLLEGWAEHRERWVIDHKVFHGYVNQPEVWAELSEYISQPFTHPSGVELFIERTAIDSGHATSHVYDWVRKQATGRVIAVKGGKLAAGIISQPSAVDVSKDGQKKRRGAKVWSVDVSRIKSEVYGALLIEPGQDGRAKGMIHLPRMEDEFYRQAVSEELRTRMVNGQPRQEWHKTRDRNEILDLLVYNRAAHASLGVDNWPEHKWKQLAKALTTDPAVEKPVAEKLAPPEAFTQSIVKQARERAARKPLVMSFNSEYFEG